MVNYSINTDKDYKKRLLIIYTGGTLGMVYDSRQETLVPFRFEKILESIPELERIHARLEIMAMEPPIDSSDMTPEIWIAIAGCIEENYDVFDGFVILHGTDTMAYTASALSFMLENLGKPVILTGAQLPIGLARTDARENMMTSLELALDPENILNEVCIYFNGRLLRGNRSKKYESSQFDAFHSENYPYLADIGVYSRYNYPYLLKNNHKPFKVWKYLDNSVFVIKLFPGIKTDLISKLLTDSAIKAVVLETFGSGNAGTAPHFLKLLEQASSEGKILLNISQCSGGEVRQKDYAAGRGLSKAGIISGKDMTTEAAVTKLMFLLGRNMPKQKIIEMLQENLRGELTD
jgi:L-asparaginase